MTDKRVFTKDFKEGVVRFVVEGGRAVTEVNRELDIHQNVIFKRGPNGGRPKSKRGQENEQLTQRINELVCEREIFIMVNNLRLFSRITRLKIIPYICYNEFLLFMS